MYSEPILEGFHLVVALNHFVELKTDETSDERSRGCNGRDDFPGNQLRLVTVGRSDAVVGGAEVGGGHDEVHVEVGVIVFLKVGRTNDGRRGQFFRDRKLLNERVDVVLMK